MLGRWASATEGAKPRMQILTEIRNRGVREILIASVDGLKGFPDAIQAVYPQTEVQLYIVHMVRNRLADVSWKDRKQVAADLKLIYRAASASEAEPRLPPGARTGPLGVTTTVRCALGPGYCGVSRTGRRRTSAEADLGSGMVISGRGTSCREVWSWGGLETSGIGSARRPISPSLASLNSTL